MFSSRGTGLLPSSTIASPFVNSPSMKPSAKVKQTIRPIFRFCGATAKWTFQRHFSYYCWTGYFTSNNKTEVSLDTYLDKSLLPDISKLMILGLDMKQINSYCSQLWLHALQPASRVMYLPYTRLMLRNNGQTIDVRTSPAWVVFLNLTDDKVTALNSLYILCFIV